MAMYIEFHRKGATDMAAGSGVALATVDDEMRAAFGAEPSADEWFRAWIDQTGLALACGRSVEWVEANMPDQAEIARWLEANFDWSSWSGR